MGCASYIINTTKPFILFQDYVVLELVNNLVDCINVNIIRIPCQEFTKTSTKSISVIDNVKKGSEVNSYMQHCISYNLTLPLKCRRKLSV